MDMYYKMFYCQRKMNGNLQRGTGSNYFGKFTAVIVIGGSLDSHGLGFSCRSRGEGCQDFQVWSRGRSLWFRWVSLTGRARRVDWLVPGR